MSYVIYHKETTKYLTDVRFQTERAAKAQRTKICKKEELNPEEYQIARYDIFCESIQKTRTVTNLMSGGQLDIPVNTPPHLDPSCESYWSM